MSMSVTTRRNDTVDDIYPLFWGSMIVEFTLSNGELSLSDADPTSRREAAKAEHGCDGGQALSFRDEHSRVGVTRQ
jgi:hypothetical protein